MMGRRPKALTPAQRREMRETESDAVQQGIKLGEASRAQDNYHTSLARAASDCRNAAHLWSKTGMGASSDKFADEALVLDVLRLTIGVSSKPGYHQYIGQQLFTMLPRWKAEAERAQAELDAWQKRQKANGED